MSEGFLLPYRYKPIGWWLLAIFGIAGLIVSISGYEVSWLNARVLTIWNTVPFGNNRWFSLSETNLTTTIVGVLFIAGALLVGFSKEKTEDEFILRLRLSSLLWAVWLNAILLMLSFLFVYGMAFLTVMMYNMFTVLIIFIIRFNYLLYKNTKATPDEKYH